MVYYFTLRMVLLLHYAGAWSGARRRVSSPRAARRARAALADRDACCC